MFFNQFKNNILEIGLFPEAIDILIEALKNYEGKSELEAQLAITMYSFLEAVRAAGGER